VDPLPSYTHPPVVETAIALQFHPLKGFRNVHLWEFWNEIRNDYPVTQDQEPLAPKMELFGEDVQHGPLIRRIQIRPYASRLQALSDDGHAMIQIQNGRFIYNWRRLEGGDYPRWSKTVAEFHARFRQLQDYVKAHGLGDIVPDQWEVTYVNHLMQGSDWQSQEEWPEMLCGIVGTCAAVSVGKLESIDCRVQYVLEQESGRLYVDLKKAVLASDRKQELLVLTLTTRGGVSAKALPEMGLEVGHRAIVIAFTEITGKIAQKRWGRTQ
jgi:uncharacterized protein (TIGR04255 family)